MDINGEEVLKEDVVNIINVKYKIPTLKRIILSLLLGIIFLVFSMFLHNELKNKKEFFDILKYKLSLSIVFFCSCFMFVDVIILLMMIFLTFNNFLRLIIYKKRIHIVTSISILIYCFILHFYERRNILLSEDLLLDKKAFEASMIHDENVDIKEDFEYKKYFVENFASIILSLSCFNLIMIIKSLLMTIFQLKMYFNVYKKRIDKNEKDTKILDFLNETTGLKMFSNIKTWADFVFKNINPDQDTFTYEKSIFVFGEERTKLIFDLFDMNNDKSVTSFEFISVYFGVIRDRYFLSKALLQKNNLFSKLNTIINCLIIPFGIFLSISILGYASYFKNIISVISGILLSLSFIFSSVVGEMFRSLIFIFLVRPFETGDYIKINDELMVVQELGILYSSFFINGLVTYIENTKIMDKKIINYRISDVEEKTYKYRFNNILFRKVRNQLHDKLQNILKQNTKIYTGKFKLTNYKIINEFIDVEIVIAFKINYQYIKGLANNEDNIVFILEDIFKELMLN